MFIPMFPYRGYRIEANGAFRMIIMDVGDKMTIGYFMIQIMSSVGSSLMLW